MPSPTATCSPDPEVAAASAGLTYVQDAGPGITRRRAGKGFSYRGPDGERITDRGELARIRALAVPPAWTEVWICPDPDGHLQATGWDARGRKQYRYHPRWREVRDQAKFERLLDFGLALPQLRARVEEDLSRRGLPLEKVAGTVVHLLDRTLIRVGNEEYARANESYGLTTLRDEHADIDGCRVTFTFRGKGGQAREQVVSDRRLARIVRRCQDLPGQVLFQYVEAGEQRTIGSRDVNAYLQDATGGPFTAKDFRTWAASAHVAATLAELPRAASEAEAKRQALEAVRSAACLLANTPAVCRASYVHPAVLEAHECGALRAMPEAQVRRALATRPALQPAEAALVVLLRRARRAGARNLTPIWRETVADPVERTANMRAPRSVPRRSAS